MIAPLLIIQLASLTSIIKYLTYLSGAQMLGLGLAKPIGSWLSSFESFAITYYIFSSMALIVATVFFLYNYLFSTNMGSFNQIDTLTFSNVKKILKTSALIPMIVIGIVACSFAGLGSFQFIYAEQKTLIPIHFS